MDEQTLSQLHELKWKIDRDMLALNANKRWLEIREKAKSETYQAVTPDYIKKEIAVLSAEIKEKQRRYLEAKDIIAEYLATIEDPYIRQLLTWRYLEVMTWPEVAIMAGGKSKDNGVRVMCERYLKKHNLLNAATLSDSQGDVEDKKEGAQ